MVDVLRRRRRARAEAALEEASEHRPRLALQAFGIWHIPLLLGIVGTAFGLKKAFGHAYEPADLADALGLAAGTAAFLAGDVLFRRVLGFGEGPWRTGAAVPALATIPLGLLVAPAAQIAALAPYGRSAGARAPSRRRAARGQARLIIGAVRAISPVVRPPSVRRVRATCASVARVGGQQVKTSSSRSSGKLVAFIVSLAASGTSSRRVFAASVRSRRM